MTETTVEDVRAGAPTPPDDTAEQALETARYYQDRCYRLCGDHEASAWCQSQADWYEARWRRLGGGDDTAEKPTAELDRLRSLVAHFESEAAAWREDAERLAEFTGDQICPTGCRSKTCGRGRAAMSAHDGLEDALRLRAGDT